MHVGRERPPEGRAWGEEGGSQMGVARPAGRSARLRQRGRPETGGTERRPGQSPANSQTENNMSVAYFRHWSNQARAFQRERFLGLGNGAPEFRFPLPVPR
jgi:hypothetical protein